MAYHFIEFDGVDLPIGNPRQDHSPMAAESSLLRSVGGIVDYYGSDAGRATSQVHTLTGVYMGQVTYWVDEAGNYLVDEAGNRMIAGDAPTVFRSKVEALRSKIRTRARLTRIRLDDNARQWKTARFLSMSQPQEFSDRTIKAEITCQFETLDDGWHSETLTTVNGGAGAGLLGVLSAENGGGMTINDATLTITRASGTITQLDIEALAAGIDLRWTGSLSSGSLVIDCYTGTVRLNGANAYSSGFVQGGHTARGWLPLAQGTTPITILPTGGAVTFALTYYLQFP